MNPLAPVAAAAAVAVAWGWFEAGWVRLRTLACPVPGLPQALAGLRIAHLSDFHLGVPSRSAGAVERAVAWAAQRDPELVCITGDLLTRPRGLQRLRELLARLPGAYLVLGNHDVGIAKDPFMKPTQDFDPAPARILSGEAVTVEFRGRRVQLVGVDPRSFLRGTARPEALVDAAADLRILLCHFPDVVDDLPTDAFHLVLAGHFHDGQIAIPYGVGKLRLSRLSFTYPAGLYRLPSATMHVSPGLGTTFVPVRFFARPEATELVLQRA